MTTINPLRLFNKLLPGIFASFVSNRRVNKFNKLLLISLRVGRTLIRIFSADHENYHRNWYWCLSRPSRAVDSWENSSEYAQFLVVFGSAQAGPQRTIPFFCWDRAAFVGQIRGREFSNSRNAAKRNADKNAQSASFFYQLACFFEVTLLHRPHIFLKNLIQKWPKSSVHLTKIGRASPQ